VSFKPQPTPLFPTRLLTEHGRSDEAIEALAYIGHTSAGDNEVMNTLNDIKADFAGRQTLSIYRQFKMMGESRPTAIRSFIPFLVIFFQQWTGTNAINYYSPQIFASLGIAGTTTQLLATGVYGVVKVICVALALAVAVDKLGRKKCMIIGGMGQAVAMFWLGGYTRLRSLGTHISSGNASIAAVYLYAAFFSLGWGPVPWIVAGEVAPNHVRTPALAIVMAANWLLSFTISKITPILFDKIHYGTFFLFGACCLFMGFWAYVFFPETAGYPLEDIRYLFEKDMVVRALQDAPGGHLFLGGKRAAPVWELKAVLDTNQLDGSEEGNEAVENVS
jgi:sugar porter (SP) family MFS transporter